MNDKELLNSKKIWLKRKKYEKYLLHTKEAYIHIFSILQNNIKKEILKFVGNKITTIEDIKNYFNLNIYELKSHLSLLEQALFLKKTNTGYRVTSKGIVFLKNIEE